jgi:hypothetical protein
MNYNSHNPESPPVAFPERLCPISHLPFRALGNKVVRQGGLGLERAFLPLVISASFCRASNSGMLGHSIRRFTTSVIRRSHYEEGPGKVSV